MGLFRRKQLTEEEGERGIVDRDTYIPITVFEHSSD
jgi:hypothetical protein